MCVLSKDNPNGENKKSNGNNNSASTGSCRDGLLIYHDEPGSTGRGSSYPLSDETRRIPENNKVAKHVTMTCVTQLTMMSRMSRLRAH